MRMVEKNGQILLQGVSCFDLGRTLDCGQCFSMETLSRRLLGGRLLRNLLPGQAGAHCFDFYPYKPPAHPGLLDPLFRPGRGLYYFVPELLHRSCFMPGCPVRAGHPSAAPGSVGNPVLFYHQSKQQYPSHSRHYRAVLFSFGRSDGKRPAGFSHAGTALLMYDRGSCTAAQRISGQVPSGCGAKSVFRRCQSKNRRYTG